MDLPRRTLLRTVGASLGVGATGLGGRALAAPAEDPADGYRPADDSNYESASRDAEDVDWIVLHTTAGSYEGAVSWFQNPDANVSAHYVVRDEDGHVTRMVDPEDVAWHAAPYNGNSVGIEHEWYPDQGPVSRTAMAASARLVRYLASEYDVPLVIRGPEEVCEHDGGIVAHTDVPVDDGCDLTVDTACPEGFAMDEYRQLLASGVGCGEFADRWRRAGTVADGQRQSHEYRLRTDDACRVGVSLAGDDDADLDLYLTLDGRTPTRADYDRTSLSPTGRERIVLDGDALADVSELGLSVLARGDDADYTLLVREDGDVDGRFPNGTVVHTTANLWVRTAPGFDGEKVTVLGAGESGRVVAGPVDDDGYTWWALSVSGWDRRLWAPGPWLDTDEATAGGDWRFGPF
jgi:hypothetical protein